MAKEKFKSSINLLPQEEFETTTLGRTLKWLVTTFRYIVIGTELIVMIAFLSRFYLDAKSSDLLDQINQKKGIVASYSTFEKEFRSTQDRLKIYKDYAADGAKIGPLLEKLRSAMPQEVILKSILTSGQSVQITAETQSESSATAFVQNLNSLNILTSAAIFTVETQEETQAISFVVTGTLGSVIQKGGENGQQL